MLAAALREGTFVKITLSRSRGAQPDLRNVYGRAVELRSGPHLSLVYRHATRDVTKNCPQDEAVAAVEELLAKDFLDAHLFTTGGDWQFRCVGGKEALKASRPVFVTAPSPEHNREKQKALNSAAPFLQHLGVVSATGEARPAMADKLRQIQRFVEILGHSVNGSALRDCKSCRVVDMGAGKGYLTFATAQFFRDRGVEARVTGVEARADLVAATNRTAKETGFDLLDFVQGTIESAEIGSSIDLLIALHACDTATDDALAQGIAAGASLILASPCCHKEVRSHWNPPEILRDVVTHGILAEREAEIVTDSIRALLLEIHGYKTSVFEFISADHTGKNLMISAQKRATPLDPEPLRARLQALLEFYGIRKQRLAERLGEWPEESPVVS